MATAIQFLRSSIASLRPAPPSLSDGMPMVNFNASDPGLYFKLNDQSLMKIGPTQIGDSAPNTNATGYDLYSKGEMWLDTTFTPNVKPRPVLKLWDGTTWVAGGGDIHASEIPQPPGFVLIGPVNSPDFVPTFRRIEDTDLPNEISPNKLGGFEDGKLLIGGTIGGFAENHLGLGDNSIVASVGENALTIEVTAGNIAGVGPGGTIKSGDGHIQLNYDGVYTADNRFKFKTDTGTLLSHGPTELGSNPLTDTHIIKGDTTISGDVVLTNVYNMTIGGDAFVGHNMTIGSDITELLDIYNKTEFHSDVFIRDNKTLDIDGFLTVHENTIIGDSDAQTLVVNATTTIPAAVTIGRACTQETFTVKSYSEFECDVHIQGDLSTLGDVEFPGDVLLGSSCADFIAVKGTQLNQCDIYIGSNVPDPNAEQIHLEAATGNITTKGTANITGDLIVSSPLIDENFIVDSATGDATSKGTVTAEYFIGDGSQLYNLAIPNSMLFHGDIDATATAAPASPLAGDFYLNNTTGLVIATWPDIGGQPINQDQFIYFYSDSTSTGKWALGSVQNNQGFVTINTPQNINGSKTFKAHTQFDNTITVAADKATLLGGTLTVEKETVLNDTFTVANNKASLLNGTLQVQGATQLNNTLTVDDGKATVLGGTLQVKQQATFNNTLTVDPNQASTFGGTVTVTDKLTTLFASVNCAAKALQVNGLSVFDCSATFNASIILGPGSNLEVGGNLEVLGNTILGTSCAASALTVKSTTTIECATTITNTLTVSGNFATTLGGTLTVAGATQLNNTLTVAADKATTLGGTLTVAKATQLNDTLTVAANKATSLGGTLNVAADKATTLGGTLTVSKATTLNDTLTVAANKASSLGGTLQVLDSTTLLTTKDCTKTALTVNGKSVFKCLASFEEGLIIPGDFDLDVGGDLHVNGNTILGTTCTNTLLIRSTTTIQCATTISNTLTVSGNNATTLGGTLTVTGTTQLNNTLTVAADKATTLGGTLTVTGNSTLNGTLSVAANKATTLGGTLTVTGATTLSSTLGVAAAATFSSTVAITGKTTITSSAVDALAITGKATSASTAISDAGTTLVTKDYLTSGSGSGTGQFGYWVRTGTTLSMVNSADAVSLGNTLTVTNGTTLNGALAVKGISTIRHLRVEAHNTYDIGLDGTRFKDLFLSGAMKSATISTSGNATIGGKATSFSTGDSDSDTTLVTKDYLQSKIAEGTNIDTITGGDGIQALAPDVNKNVVISVDYNTNKGLGITANQLVTKLGAGLEFDATGNITTSTNSLAYKGTVDLTAGSIPSPAIQGDSYANTGAGVMSAAWKTATGLGATDVQPGDLAIYNGTAWTYVPTGGVASVTDLGLANRNTLTLDVTSTTGQNVTIPAATNLLSGLMTAADKANLDSLGASAGVLADGKIWVGNASSVQTAQTMSGDVTITRAAVASIKNSVALSGSPTTTTQAIGTDNTTIATTAFVKTAVAAAANNGQINFNAGTGLTSTGTNATANQSGDTTKEFSIDTAYLDTLYEPLGSSGGVTSGQWEVTGSDLQPIASNTGKNVTPISDGNASLGTATKRWANVYTQDMHFSNEGTEGNSVDGTTGNWTLQEGHDHLYFINNKTGMKFRVVMEQA